MVYTGQDWYYSHWLYFFLPLIYTSTLGKGTPWCKYDKAESKVPCRQFSPSLAAQHITSQSCIQWRRSDFIYWDERKAILTGCALSARCTVLIGTLSKRVYCTASTDGVLDPYLLYTIPPRTYSGATHQFTTSPTTLTHLTISTLLDLTVDTYTAKPPLLVVHSCIISDFVVHLSSSFP